MCMQCVASGMTYAFMPLSGLYVRSLVRGRRRRDEDAEETGEATDSLDSVEPGEPEPARGV